MKKIVYSFAALAGLLYASAAAAATTNVQITSTGFSQLQVNITAGDTVTWTNNDTTDHSVRSDPYPTDEDLPDLNSGTIAPGGTYSYTYNNEGEFGFHDEIADPYGGGFVTVGSTTPSPTPTPSPAPSPSPTPSPSPSPSPTPPPPPPSSGGGGGGPSGGGGGGGTASPMPTPPPSSGDTSLAFYNIKLVYEGKTFFVIKDNQRYGVTNEGALYSYGLEFKDGIPETASQSLLPYTQNLKPGDGSLVKKPNDPTVWLIADGSKHGFASEQVFTGLGFKFSNVLVILPNELDSVPVGDVLNKYTQAHRTGTYINQDGTIYRVTSGQKQGIPSIDVFNSLNIDNDFSHVVTANQADRSLPVGAVLQKRTFQ